MCPCISNTSLKVLCFPSSFQNLGIRCVKKKEVKEAIISRIRAGINPFNGTFDMTIYIICVSQILFLLSSISLKYISFVIWAYVFKAILSSVFTFLLVNLHLDLRNEVYLKLSVWKINFYADRCQWRVSFFSVRKPQKCSVSLWMWPFFCHSSRQDTLPFLNVEWAMRL